MGLGNRGALAAKPVMEGKAVLYKRDRRAAGGRSPVVLVRLPCGGAGDVFRCVPAVRDY